MRVVWNSEDQHSEDDAMKEIEGVPNIEGFRLKRADANRVNLCACGCGFPTRNGWVFRKYHSSEKGITFEQEREFARLMVVGWKFQEVERVIDRHIKDRGESHNAR